MKVSLRGLAEVLAFIIVGAGLPFEPHIAKAQFPPVPFPVLQVDSAVRARLAEEWEPNNRFQHERGYCVRYTTEQVPASWFHPPIVVYTLVEISRGEESHTRQTGLGGIGCPNASDITLLHVHPPYFCSEDEKAAACSQVGSDGAPVLSQRHRCPDAHSERSTARSDPVLRDRDHPVLQGDLREGIPMNRIRLAVAAAFVFFLVFSMFGCASLPAPDVVNLIPIKIVNDRWEDARFYLVARGAVHTIDLIPAKSTRYRYVDARNLPAMDASRSVRTSWHSAAG
jgi:hypothetical protein